MKKVYQLKITLKGIRPPVWRRVKVNGDITFEYLHQLIQTVMGWDNYHLYEFGDRNMRIGMIQDDDFGYGEDIIDASKKELQTVLKRKGSKIDYTYDFGDSWLHEIKVEETFNNENLEHPVCLKGKRACPPEDCGGVWGYQSLLEVLKNHKHPDYEEMKDWIDEDFDSESFDLESINIYLKDF